jgi:hypothetical protein
MTHVYEYARRLLLLLLEVALELVLNGLAIA